MNKCEVRSRKSEVMGRIGRIALIALIALISPMSAPGQTVRDVTVDATGALSAPVNLWSANAEDIAAALTISGTMALPTEGTMLTLTPSGTSANIGVTLAPKGAGDGALSGTWNYGGNPMVEGSSINAGYASNAANALFANSAGDANNATWAATADEVIAPYAVIWIPLPPGSQWTDFELKASINNFTNDATGMKFFYHSPDPAKASIPGQVWTNRPDVYFTDSGKTGTPNRRAWIKQSATQSIFAMLADANSEVGGFVIVVKDDLSAYRSQLVWSYALMDGTSTDDDPAARSVWRPAWPAQWVQGYTPPGT